MKHIIIVLSLLLLVAACVPGDKVNGNTVNNENSMDDMEEVSGEVQMVHVGFSNGNYDLSTDTIKVGKPVKMMFVAEQLPGCSRSVTIPEYGIKQLITAENNIVEFTPTKVGDITISCSMGMYIAKLKAE